MPGIPDNDMLSPSSAPNQLGKLVGVRRVNNLPLYIIGTVIIAFVIMVIWVGVERGQSEVTSRQMQDKHGDSAQLAKSIAGSRTGGMIPAAGSSPLPNQALTVPIAIPDDLDKPPLPKRLKETAAIDPDMDHIKQEKMQLFENAVTGKTTVPVPELKAHGDSGDQREETLQRIEDAQQRIAAVQNDPNTVFTTRLAQLQGGNGTSGNSLPKLMEASKSQRNDLKQFDARDKSDRWQLDSKVEAPKTPYTLRAGFVIPASLISGINSDLPGQIIGQISQNVYDTATGKYLLIPQASRLVGTYTSDVSYGQSRVFVAWQRIIFPDGKTLDIGAMPGADGAGYAGMGDQVDNHYLRLFGSAILMSGITAGATLSQNNTAGLYTQPTVASALSEALGQQLGNTTTQMINKNLNISPTLEIRSGFRFNVMCIKDLVLTKPYSSFDY